MLVLTRKLGEGIAIGDDIKIIVMQIKGKQVRLGIKANPNTIVHREEVYRRIQEENRSASQMSKEALEEAAALVGTNRPKLGNLRLRKRINDKKS